MITLNEGERIDLETGEAVETHWASSFVDSNGSNTWARSGASDTVSTADDTDISGSPATGLLRSVGFMSASNQGSDNQTVSYKRWNGTDHAYLFGPVTLRPMESAQYNDGRGFEVFDSAGRKKVTSPGLEKFVGWATDFNKLGAGATEAAGVPYLLYRDTGFPGSWSIGTPGVNGRICEFSTETGGFLTWRDASAGKKNYLTSFVAAASGNGTMSLIDILWVNTGLTVTTTTAQAITTPTWPARDLDEDTDGVGVQVAIVVTGATTNGSAITNCTLNYTNSAGTSGRTATISSFPATCTAGSMIIFQLEAGDRGVRSIEGITLGTSMASGSISLIAFRRVAMTGCASTWAANPELSPSERGAGVELFDESCLMPMLRPATATTYNCEGLITIEER